MFKRLASLFGALSMGGLTPSATVHQPEIPVQRPTYTKVKPVNRCSYGANIVRAATRMRKRKLSDDLVFDRSTGLIRRRYVSA